jgi:hypothetical protein
MFNVWDMSSDCGTKHRHFVPRASYQADRRRLLD